MDDTSLCHYGILGQKWGVRRYQNPDGSYTEEGKRRRYQNPDGSYTEEGKRRYGKLSKDSLAGRAVTVAKTAARQKAERMVSRAEAYVNSHDSEAIREAEKKRREYQNLRRDMRSLSNAEIDRYIARLNREATLDNLVKTNTTSDGRRSIENTLSISGQQAFAAASTAVAFYGIAGLISGKKPTRENISDYVVGKLNKR
jgi:hypothetical protein